MAAIIKCSVFDLEGPGSPESSIKMYCLFIRVLYLINGIDSSVSRKIFVHFVRRKQR